MVNVNTTASMTRTIAAAAEAAAAAGTSILPITPAFGPESVEGNFESYLAAVGVMRAVTRFVDGARARDPGTTPFDAVIQAGYGEHGREGLQELLDVPVVDITEAAAQIAMLLGRRYSVVTTLARAVGQIEDRLTLAGLAGRCASVRSTGLAVLDIELDPERAAHAIFEQARRAVEDDGAEVICLGCSGMAGLPLAIARDLQVPAVDGVAAAVKLAESVVALGLTTSKINSYAFPRPKAVAGWADLPG